MKKVRRYIERLLPVVAALALVSCNLDELDEVKKPIDPNGRVGSLVIESLVINTDNEYLDRGSNSATRAEGDNQFRVPNPNGATEYTADYWIEVFDADGEVVDINGEDVAGTGMTVEDINKLETEITLPNQTKPMKIKGAILPPGMYTVWAYKDSTKGENIPNVTPEGSTNGSTVAYYIGHQEVEVLSTEDLEGDATSTPVTITCKLAQTLVTVEMSADMERWFDVTNSYDVTDGTPLQTTVTIAPETPVKDAKYSHTFPFNTNHGEKDTSGNVVNGGPFVYFKDHAGPNSTDGNTMVFKMEGVYLNLSVEYRDDAWDDLKKKGSSSTYYNNLIYVSMEREFTSVKAAQWRRISIDIDHDTEGDVQFKVTINSYVFDEEVEVDVQTMFFSVGDKPYQEEEVPDIDPQAPSVKFNIPDDADAVIAEDLYNTGMTKWDANLEMKVTPSTGASITQVYADISSDNANLMAALAAAGYTDGRVTFYQNSTRAEETTNKSYFVVNSDNPSSNITVTLSDVSMRALQDDYKGTHSVRVWTKDSEDRMKYTDLTIKSGDATGGNIGSASGSGSGDGVINDNPPTIVWVGHDIDGEHELTTDGIDCTIVATSTAEGGFKKFEIDIYSEQLTPEELAGVGLGSHIDLINPDKMKDALTGLGFLPSGIDSWEGQKKAEFTITGFMSILGGFSGYHEFQLTVGDANGTTVKSVKLNVK